MASSMKPFITIVPASVYEASYFVLKLVEVLSTRKESWEQPSPLCGSYDFMDLVNMKKKLEYFPRTFF